MMQSKSEVIAVSLNYEACLQSVDGIRPCISPKIKQALEIQKEMVILGWQKTNDNKLVNQDIENRMVECRKQVRNIVQILAVREVNYQNVKVYTSLMDSFPLFFQ